MEIRIAICDDEMYICTQLEEMLMELLKERGIVSDIDVFTSGESLCIELERQEYDILFLDIELPKISGIDVGRFIRDRLLNESVQIAYISAKEQYAMELFEFRPIHFLIKPLEQEAIAKLIDRYLSIRHISLQLYSYKIRNKYHKVLFSDIIFFESQKRKIVIHTSRGTEEFYESIENVYHQVKNANFLWIHKSYIVNYQYIKKFAYEQIELMDGTVLSVSQARRKEVKEKYMKLRKDNA